MAKIRANNYYNPSVADPLNPVTFVNKINVLTFMVCQWKDEQAGGHCPNLVQYFTGTSKKWFTFTNGAHIDSLDPNTYDRWYDFLQLFVAHEAPIVNQAATRAAAPAIYQAAMGLPHNDVVCLPPDPIQERPTYQSAISAFEALPEVRVLFENGAGSLAGASSNPGDPYPTFEQSFSNFPIPGTSARTWYFGPGGTLQDNAPRSAGTDTYTSNASAVPLTDYSGNTGSGGLWGNASQWEWNWQHNPSGSAVSYTTAPLSANTGVTAGGAVHAWIRSSTPDVDLQATISEVSPDGHETLVQDGWLRASERKLATTSDNIFKQAPTTVEPIPTFLASDAQPMPAGQFAELTIPLYFEGHAYRAGWRIRVAIAAPNGTQPIWSFDETQPAGVRIAQLGLHRGATRRCGLGWQGSTTSGCGRKRSLMRATSRAATIVPALSGRAGCMAAS
jgi:hypothetical protein